MLRSSTSNSEPRGRWRRVALLGLGVILAAEAGLRLPPVAAVVGEPDVYYHPGVTERLDALEALERAGERIDVLFVGSSVVRTNVSPLVFDAALAREGVEVTSFNAGLSSLLPDPVLLYLDRLWLDAARPRVVMQAVRYEDLADAIMATEFEPFDGGRYERLWLDDSPLARAQETMLDRSELIQRAGVLTELLALPGALRNEGFDIDERGFGATQQVLASVRSELDLEEIPGGNAVIGGYNELPIDDAVFASGLRIVGATIRRVEASGATFVLINMPEHGEKFIGHPDGRERYEHYLRTIAQYAADEGVAFVDLAGDGLDAYMDDTRFADFNHFTPEAASELTRRLADFALSDSQLRRALEGS